MTQTSQPCYRIQLLDISADTPVTRIFQHFANQSWSVLLDSANSNHPDSRFDLFVAHPIATVESKEQHITVTDKLTGKITCSQGNPLKMLQQVIDESLIAIDQVVRINELTLPFKSGAVGYFGYDLGRCFESLPEQHKQSYNSPDMAIGIYTWCVIKDNQQNTFYLVSRSDFDSPDVAEIEKLATTDTPSSNDFKLTSHWQSNMSKPDYVQKMTAVHQYLCAGDCYQVNLAQRFHATYQGDNWQAYLRLRAANQAPFSAFINLPDAAVVSISPERFLQVQQGRVQTKPIKGTRPRGKTLLEDEAEKLALRDSAKDRAENLMIVDLLRNDLSRSCQNGSIEVPELFAIESFEAVHHLVSTVTGLLRQDKSSLDLLQGAFPGGSITGAPKVRAMQIIDELEPHRRHIYCGSIGYVDRDGNMDTNICIRTLLFEKQNVYCWAGGGIVLDSQPESEYQESFDKVAKILPVLEGR